MGGLSAGPEGGPRLDGAVLHLDAETHQDAVLLQEVARLREALGRRSDGGAGPREGASLRRDPGHVGGALMRLRASSFQGGWVQRHTFESLSRTSASPLSCTSRSAHTCPSTLNNKFWTDVSAAAGAAAPGGKAAPHKCGQLSHQSSSSVRLVSI